MRHIPKAEYSARFIELDHRGYVWKDQVYQRLVSEYSITKISWEQLLQDYVKECKNHCVPFPHLIEMLTELKKSGFALGIITNGYGQLQMNHIRALGIASYVDVIVISEWEGIKKPDARIFYRALNKLHCHPHESVYVGDHPINDLKAARAVGMTGIWKRDAQWNDVDADAMVDELGEIPMVVQNLSYITKLHT
ncbi:L-2-haloalkanoic acid dehalogenase [Fictibacillus macauensis ZFHKF-1]|uniref:L-2-haloalkanoic acid dehalogenase n=1 Tax=Fictibacillus macauensis ZFHKF-1 TaxID=1196324 RepID=I8AFT3_9BACL|nr:L-2-haloalkanoic acid dehalogenase [Fictibacillus macauensis ZFHKF-1]